MSGRDPMEILASLDLDTSEGTSSTENTPPVEDNTSETETVETVEASEPADATDAVDADTTTEPVIDETPALAGGRFKSVEELEKAYQHAERRMHEEIRQKKEYEQYLAQLEQHQQQAAFDPRAPRNYEELIEYTYDAPEDAFWFAVENAPNAAGRVLAEIRSFDPRAADQLMFDYQQWQTSEQTTQLQQQVEEAKQKAELPVLQHQAERAIYQAYSKIASMPNYEHVKDEMASLLRDRPHLISMESESTLMRGLHDVYELAVARSSDRLKRVSSQREQAAGSAGVETGGFNDATAVVVDENPTDLIRSSIFEAANRGAF